MSLKIVTTESGSRYEFQDRLMRKRDSVGRWVDTFKAYSIKAVPTDVKTMEEIHELPESDPEIGKLLYVAGLDAWWLSTVVVRIQDFKDENENEEKEEDEE
jgi:hypothetical protein